MNFTVCLVNINILFKDWNQISDIKIKRTESSFHSSLINEQTESINRLNWVLSVELCDGYRTQNTVDLQ